MVPTCVQELDLHPGRNVYLTSWFILSVFFLTGGETSVVPTHVFPGSPVTWTSIPVGMSTLTSWLILSVLFLTAGEMSVVPTRVWDPPVTRTSTQ